MGYFALFLVLTGITGFFFFRKREGIDKEVKYAFLAVASIGLVGTLSLSLYTVAPGEVGVEVLFGSIQGFRESGMHAKLPFAQVFKFDVKTRKSQQEAEAASSDLQVVKVQAVINYRLDAGKISKLYQNVGHDYETKVVLPIIQECVKAGVARYKVEDIIVKRMELKAAIEDLIKDRMTTYYMILEGVNLQNIDFSKEFNRVVEEKQIAEQQIKTAEYNRQRAEKEKQTTILQAQAEAEKQRLLAVSTSRDVVDLKWIEKWDGQLPSTVLGSSVPMVNLGK
jgi:regulator of protease activity HflC (stomatin/prohibitin superfamily)